MVGHAFARRKYGQREANAESGRTNPNDNTKKETYDA